MSVATRLVRLAAAALFSLLVAAVVVEVAIRSLDLFSEARGLAPEPTPADEERPGAYRSLFKTQVHPYRGWTFRPGTDISEGMALLAERGRSEEPSEWALARSRVNAFGFFSAVDDYRSLPTSHYVVAVLGGSVAGAVVSSGGPALVAALEERFPEAGPIELVSLAAPAYKQPQQLIVLMEMALLDVPIDLVINLDGFNEVDAGRRDARDGFHPLYPSQRQYALSVGLTRRAPSDDAILGAARVLGERRAERDLLEWISASPLGHSQLLRAAAGARALRHRTRARELEGELQQRTAQGDRDLSAPGLGAACLGPDGDCTELVADLWANASRLTAAVAQQMGAEYLHLLQPNQYVEGSKPLSDQERATAFAPHTEKARSAREGYPILRQRGQALRAEGVAFHDLSGLFSDTEETVYLDTCCHYNAFGNARVARAIAGLVAGPGAKTREIPQL